jgi:Tfp pilus assembly protein PilV
VRGDENGATLVEVLVSLVLIAMGLLSVAPMFISSSQGNAAGADSGVAAALAVARMEQLRATDFDDLTAGGDLASNVTDYHDLANTGFVVRWTIVDNGSPPGTKTITVRAIADRQVIGQQKSATLTVLRGR